MSSGFPVVPPGLSVNPLEDIITPVYIETLKSFGPKYLRYPEGELSQNYFWATAPTWKPTSARFINKAIWPATEAQFYTNGRPKMFNLSSFLNLCSKVKATPIIIVPLNAMFGSGKIPYADLSTNAKELVKYIKSDVIYEIGNETTMDKSYNGYTDAATYAKFAGMLIQDMKSINPRIKCIVNGDTPAEMSIVSKIPGTIGIAVHNYPGYSVVDWMKWDTKYLVKKVADCKAAANGKDIYITETSSTNFTPQENTVGLSLMNIDIILHSMVIAPKCVMNWATRWNYNVPIKPNLYCALNHDDSPTGLGHMIRLMTFALNKVCEWSLDRCSHKNVVMKQIGRIFVFTNTVTKKSTTIVINKTLKTVPLKSRKGDVYTLYGPIDSKKPLFETYATTGLVNLKPMSLTVIV